MLYKDFISLFKQQVYTLSFEEGLHLAIKVCKRLYFDYASFVTSGHWGDKDLLMDAIRFCDMAQATDIKTTQLEDLLAQVDIVTPDTDDFGDYNGSCALNAAASVYETLQFIKDKNLEHIYNIGTYLTDTVDFKIHEKENLFDKQIDEHNMMIEAKTFLLEQTGNRRTTAGFTQSGRTE